MNKNVSDFQWVIEAVRTIAGVCDGAHDEDGVGFNGRDTAFGKAIAATPDEKWTPKMIWAAHKMLRTYKNSQLAGLFDYDNLPVPPKPDSGEWAPRARPAAVVERKVNLLGGGRLLMGWNRRDPQFTELLANVKALPSRFFDKATLSWIVPLTPASAGEVLALITKFEFNTDAAAEKAINDLAADARENIEASRRSETTFQLTAKLGGTLRPFQQAGVEYAIKNKRVLIADEMGLGKTIQAIASIEELAARGEQVFPVVVVTPASVKMNWNREITKWAPGRTTEVLNGKPGTYKADYLIVNYDNLKKHVEAFATAGVKAVIADEAHYAKNQKAQRTQALKTISENLPIRILLTGTPILNRPVELLSPLSILDRVRDVGGWKKLFFHHCNAVSNGYGYDFGEPNDLEGLNAKLRASCYIRREKSQVLKELPPKQFTDVFLSYDEKLYASAEENFYKFVKNPDAAARAEHLVRINVLRQVAVQAKLDAVKEWVTDFLESGEKLVIFAYHKVAQDMLANTFPGCAVIRGEDDAATRQENVDKFQKDPSCKLIVCSIRAGAEGITLTAASNVAFVELDWNPGRLQQAEDRVHRIGQFASSVNVWRLLAQDTIDTDLAALVADKARVVKALSEGGSDAEVAIVASLEEAIQARVEARKAAKKAGKAVKA
jgi:SWI/SNF-related matrix-associated actin-dependent regulator 1 of chromatin subfamily A